MNKYQDSERFSLDPKFDLLYDGRRLLSEDEMRELRKYAEAGGRAAEHVIFDIDARFRDVVGSPALGDSHTLSSACLNALSIFEIKVRLSREQLIHRWNSPSVAADSIVLRNGKVLLVKRMKDPYKDYYALPGGILDDEETLEECALRELREETGIEGRVDGLLAILSDPARDPRVRMVSAVFVVDYVSGEPRGGDDAAEALFMDIDRLPALAYDHDRAMALFRSSGYFRRLV